MASWLIGAPGERQNSRLQRQYIQERIEARPKTQVTLEEISMPLIQKATKTKLNLSAIKSPRNTNERVDATVIR